MRPLHCKLKGSDHCNRLLSGRLIRARSHSTAIPLVEISSHVPASKPVTVSSPEDALGGLQSGHSVFVHSAAAAPTQLVQAMVAEAVRRRLDGLTVSHIHLAGPAPHMAVDVCGPGKPFRVVNLFCGANAREAVQAGRAEYVPIFLSEIPALFRSGAQPVDVALISVTPPDRHGFCSLGPSVDITRSALQVSRTIIAQVNPAMPRTFGDAVIHESRISVMWNSLTPVHALEVKEVRSSATDKIGRLIAGNLVQDGATLQMGIGNVPDAVLAHLQESGVRDLGIHSEMISDGVVPLWQKGIITGARKSIHPGKICAGFAVGSTLLYDMLHDNPGVTMRDIAFVNATDVIARQPGMTAINSALEVDITGQVAADTLGHRIISGVGGQMDFMRGAALAQNGRPIIALPSTTSKGESRIAASLKPGASVVTTRAHVHYVVTEYGIAELWGKSTRQRAAALIAIAAPEHRDTLTRAAKERMLM